MRRRLVTAILLTVWAVLVLGGAAVYFGVRTILVRDLDDLLYARAVALPELVQPPGFDTGRIPTYDWRDQYTIRSLATPQPSERTTAPAAPRLIAARFTDDSQGRRWRTVTIAAHAQSAQVPASATTTARAAPAAAASTAAADYQPVMVEYSGATTRIDRLLRKIRFALAWFVLLGGAITAGVALWVSRIVLRPLQSAAHWIGQMDERKLDERMNLERLPSELLPVSDRLNEMLARLERAFSRQKDFVAAASDELRAPIAALAHTLQTASDKRGGSGSGGAGGGAESGQVYQSCLGHVHVLRELVDRLTEFIEDARGAREAAAPTNVVRLIDDCAEAAVADLARPAHVHVQRSGPSSLHCLLPPKRLRSIVANLLANAVENNRPGGTVDLSYFHDGRQLHVRVSDDGPGIDAGHLPHLFQPVYRVPRPAGAADEPSAAPDASSPTGHLGLGLFLVQSHARAMGGQVRIDTRPGQGTAVDVEVPCEPILPEGLLQDAPPNDASSAATTTAAATG